MITKSDGSSPSSRLALQFSEHLSSSRAGFPSLPLSAEYSTRIPSSLFIVAFVKVVVVMSMSLDSKAHMLLVLVCIEISPKTKNIYKNTVLVTVNTLGVWKLLHAS